jgi:hypothetical protein
LEQYNSNGALQNILPIGTLVESSPTWIGFVGRPEINNLIGVALVATNGNTYSLYYDQSAQILGLNFVYQIPNVGPNTKLAQKSGCQYTDLGDIISVSPTPTDTPRPTPPATPPLTPTPTRTTPFSTPQPTMCTLGGSNALNCIKSIKLEVYHSPFTCNGAQLITTLGAKYTMAINGFNLGFFGWSWFTQGVGTYTPGATYLLNLSNRCTLLLDCDDGKCCCPSECGNSLIYNGGYQCCSSCRDDYNTGPFGVNSFFRYKNTTLQGERFDFDICRFQNDNYVSQYFPGGAPYPNDEYQGFTGVGDAYKLWMVEMNCGVGLANCIGGTGNDDQINRGKCASVGYEIKMTAYSGAGLTGSQVWTITTCITDGDRIFFNPCNGYVATRIHV